MRITGSANKRGGVMSIDTFDRDERPGPRSFPLGDVLLAVGIWGVILGLSPLIAFHLLSVN
jgi:hypothetical protein